jgi:hypothetical protein
LKKNEKLSESEEEVNGKLVIESQGNTPIKNLEAELIELSGTPPDHENDETDDLENELVDDRKMTPTKNLG